MKVVFKVAASSAEDSASNQQQQQQYQAVIRPRTSINSPRRRFDYYGGTEDGDNSDRDRDEEVGTTSPPSSVDDRYVRPIEDVQSFQNAAIDRLTVAGREEAYPADWPNSYKYRGGYIAKYFLYHGHCFKRILTLYRDTRYLDRYS